MARKISAADLEMAEALGPAFMEALHGGLSPIEREISDLGEQGEDSSADE